MIDQKCFDKHIHVAIKSYKRAKSVRTIDYFPFGYIWVPDSQGEEYKSMYGDRVLTIPDELDGNLTRKMNAILDRSPRKWTLILDDDISGIGYWENGGHHWCNTDEIMEFVWQGFVLANDLGVKLWGINQGKDELWYHTYKPFNLLAPILGPFNGHLEPELRFDVSTDLKEDYDFWLQNIRRHRKTLRINKYHYKHDHGKLEGGQVSLRTMQREKDAVQRMTEKWGKKVYKTGGTAGGKNATGKNILNSRVTVPINGC